MLDRNRERQAILLLGGLLCVSGSIILFILKPLPPIGGDVAIGLALGTLLFLSCAFFPKQVIRVERRIQRAFEKEQHTNPGQWVP